MEAPRGIAVGHLSLGGPRGCRDALRPSKRSGPAPTAAGVCTPGSFAVVPCGAPKLVLSVADQVDWDLELTVDGDEIELELELELKWSTSGRVSGEAAEGETEEDGSEEGRPESVSEEDGSATPESGQDALAEDEAADGESAEDAAGSVQAESARVV